MQTDVKITLRRTPANIEIPGKRIVVIEGHPEIYSDQYLLLLDRTTKEAEEWRDILRRKGYSEEIKGTYQKLMELVDYYVREVYDVEPIGYEVLGGKLCVILLLTNAKDEQAKKGINAEYYVWLTKQGYRIMGDSDHLNWAFLLIRNDDLAGLVMGSVYDVD